MDRSLNLDEEGIRGELQARGLAIDGSRAVLMRRLRGSVDQRHRQPNDWEPRANLGPLPDNGENRPPSRAPNNDAQEAPPAYPEADERRENDLLRRELELVRRERNLAQAEADHFRHIANGHVAPEPAIRRPTANINDIISMLPAFDPTDRVSLDAAQFIGRIERLRDIHHWVEKSVLFATIGKLKGPAKQWYESSEADIDTWAAFSRELKANFPLCINEADVHQPLT